MRLFKYVGAPALILLGGLYATSLMSGATFAQDCPMYPVDRKKAVYLEFNDQSMVHDSHILQDGCDLKLVLIVNGAINEPYARQLGDDFVRFTKSLGPGPGPSKVIGEGIYSYTVGIFTSSKKKIVLGFKEARDKDIYWE